MLNKISCLKYILDRYKLIFLVLLSLLSLGCQDSFSEEIEIEQNIKKYRVFTTSCVDSKGVFLVVHGLNNTPDVMNELITVVNKAGFNAIRVELTGHESEEIVNNPDFFEREISVESWLNDLDISVKQAKKLYPNSPISVLGFSLGGALLIRYLDLHPEFKIEKAIFIAPAIGLFKFTNLIRIFSPLQFIGVPSISLAPEGYRRHMFPSFKFYDGLFDVYRDVQKLSQVENLKSAKPTFIMAEEDELIDEYKVERWIKNNGIEKESKSIVLKFEEGEEPEYKHQIIDLKSTGIKNWAKIESEIWSAELPVLSSVEGPLCCSPTTKP